MFDPEVELDARIRKELGLKPKEAFFRPKTDCDEEELKFRVKNYKCYPKIRTVIHDAPNRIVDTRNWTANPHALVTLNLDTADRQLAHAGYSLRVRFAFDPTKNQKTYNFDMCIKTAFPKGGRQSLHQLTRGEWETAVQTSAPNMAMMIEANKEAQRPLPNFFKDGHISDEEYFVESVGITMRNVYPSFEQFRRRGKLVTACFQHTEDWVNGFMSPLCDGIITQDSEAEAEFLGFYNLPEEDATPEEYEKLMRKSMRLLTKVITNADPASLIENPHSKSMRARYALESVYGCCHHDKGVRATFNKDYSIDQAVRHALSFQVRPEAIDLKAIEWSIAKLLTRIPAMEQAAKESPFKLQKAC